MKTNLRTKIVFAFVVCFTLIKAEADNFTMHITVDNQYAAYKGNATSTSSLIGSDKDWTTVETYTGTIDPNSEFLYVATASDHRGLQGFFADFHNDTKGISILTGDPVWQVFPAGAYLQQIDTSWPSTWPRLLMPTQTQVDQAIAYADANNLWLTPATGPGYNSGYNPWGRTFSPISSNADFIWHDNGLNNSSRAPFEGFNHDEFLVFRVAAVPEPSSGVLTLMGLAPLVMVFRRRSI
ncbi:MAG: PEP-CTERM sorting domain-containing protein [Pirellulaceae bacterium]